MTICDTDKREENCNLCVRKEMVKQKHEENRLLEYWNFCGMLQDLMLGMRIYRCVVFLCLLYKATVLLYACQKLFSAPSLGLGLQVMWICHLLDIKCSYLDSHLLNMSPKEDLSPDLFELLHWPLKETQSHYLWTQIVKTESLFDLQDLN